MCSMYNHSDNFNVVHKQDPENMIYVAKRDIKKVKNYMSIMVKVIGIQEKNNLFFKFSIFLTYLIYCKFLKIIFSQFISKISISTFQGNLCIGKFSTFLNFLLNF